MGPTTEDTLNNQGGGTSCVCPLTPFPVQSHPCSIGPWVQGTWCQRWSLRPAHQPRLPVPTVNLAAVITGSSLFQRSLTLAPMHDLFDLVMLPYLGLYTHLDHLFRAPFPRCFSYPSVGFPSLVFLFILAISSLPLLLLCWLPLTFLKHGSPVSSSCFSQPWSHTTSLGELYFLGCVFHNVLFYPKVSHSLWFVTFTSLFLDILKK